MTELDVDFDCDPPPPRTLEEIMEALDELDRRLWYGRKPLDEDIPRLVKEKGWDPGLVASMKRGKREVEARIPREVLEADTSDDWHWGFLSGKVSALRWALGEDWDQLYS